MLWQQVLDSGPAPRIGGVLSKHGLLQALLLHVALRAIELPGTGLEMAASSTERSVLTGRPAPLSVSASALLEACPRARQGIIQENAGEQANLSDV